MSWSARWRPPLRIARRDAWRHKGRSAVVLVMVALPVLAVVGMDTVFRTADVSAKEGLPRTLGTADAVVSYAGSDRPIQQYPTDLNYSSQGETVTDNGATNGPATTLAALMPPDSRMLAVLRGTTYYTTSLGRNFADSIEIDLRDPLTRGMFGIRAGRFPRTTDEVAVSQRLVERGYAVGAELRLTDGSTRRVVGALTWPAGDDTARLVVGPPGALGLAGAGDTLRTWLADTPRPLTWSQVLRLNHAGYAAVSRHVVLHPPPASRVEADFGGGGGLDSATLAVIGMIAAMAALEIVLLAGPAFAVGLRKQRRSLALLAATGGTSRDVRRVVLGGGVVLGVTAATAGVAIGVAGAWAAMPVVQRFSTSRFGPFQVSWRDTLLVAGFGAVSAVLAAVAPAFAAGRQDVVAVLAGRRGQTRMPIWSPAAGTVLLGLGIVISVLGAKDDGGGTWKITLGAIVAVVGMVLVIPIVVAQLGRLARVLPLPARFAVRDAARHRSRTAPAVAAVAATVAGVVALGIGGSSDAAQSRAYYSQRGPMGAGLVTVYSGEPVRWDQVRTAVRSQVPGARFTAMRGVLSRPAPPDPASDEQPADVLNVESVSGPIDGLSYTTSFGAEVLVGADTLGDMGLQLPAGQLARAQRALHDGQVVVFADARHAASINRAAVHTDRDDAAGETKVLQRRTVAAVAITAPGLDQPAAAVIPAALAREFGFRPETTALLVRGTTISPRQEDRVTEALSGISDGSSFWVERGFHDNSTTVALLVLGFVGGLLVLGGTLTATFLALSDARPDFATMGAVGAAPRTRRGVASAYAATIGLVGALLGAAVGFVPGVAVTYPLTSASWAQGAVDENGAPIAGHFIDVPWTLVGSLVVGLPVITAMVVGITSRSRLPMVSRLS